MVVGVCTVELQVPGCSSLKEKRQVIRSVVARVRNEFNVSIAEVGHRDSWQLATLGLACVGADARYAQGLLERALHFIERVRPDLVLLDYEMELL